MRDRVNPGLTGVRVDPIRCEGIGMCAHLAGDVIRIDPWGFPIVPSGPLTAREVVALERAASGCPRQALRMDRKQA